jgi:hypothetical protein
MLVFLNVGGVLGIGRVGGDGDAAGGDTNGVGVVCGIIGDGVESLQSHCIQTMSRWSSGLPVCYPS